MGARCLCSNNRTKASVGLVKSTTHAGKYESKWGGYPLMRHSPEYGPAIYNMQYRRYYRLACQTENFKNRTVRTRIAVTGCGDINVQNVTVIEKGELILDAAGTTTIDGPFEVESGAELKINP